MKQISFRGGVGWIYNPDHLDLNIPELQRNLSAAPLVGGTGLYELRFHHPHGMGSCVKCTIVSTTDEGSMRISTSYGRTTTDVFRSALEGLIQTSVLRAPKGAEHATRKAA